MDDFSNSLLRVASGVDWYSVHGGPQGVHSIQIGTDFRPTEADGRIRLYYSVEPRPWVSALAILNGTVDATLLDKSVAIIGVTSVGLSDAMATPVAAAMHGVEVQAQIIENVLGATRLVRLSAAPWVELGAFLALAAVLLVLMPRVRPVVNIAILLGAIAICVASSLIGFLHARLLFDPSFPAAGNVLLLVVLLTAGFAAAERQRRQLRHVFDKYMASEVVDEILRHAENIHLGGTTQELSVFFSDVADFTTISEQLVPEALVEVLNMYLSTMAEIILRHRGNVNKYLGDGIMALFGAPRGDPHHAILACYAALDCQQALEHWQQAWQARGFPELTTRIGINSGPLIVGNMGSQARMEYTAMGDSVNLASRLEGANKFYGTRILIGPHTYELACNDIEAREVDVIRVKGKKEAVVIYELLARKGALSPQKRQLVEVFLAGLTAYKQRDFATAECRFEAALCLDAADSPSQEYFRRSQEFLELPPPLDWDGVYEPPSK